LVRRSFQQKELEGALKMLPILPIGPLAVQTPGLILLIGSFHTIQLVAWIILAASLWTLGKRLFLQSGTTGIIENLHDR